MPDAAAAILIVRLIIGASLAAAPLAIHHVVEGSFGVWLHDMLFTALLIHQQDFISRVSFMLLAIGGLAGLATWENPGVVLNGVLWLSLIAAPVTLGVLLLRGFLRKNPAVLSHPLPVMASFFALVAVHYQIPIYLFFGIAPVLIALLLVVGFPRKRLAPSILMLLLSGIAVVYQAGQPVSRGLAGIIRGERVTLDAADGLPRAHVKMEKADQEIYQRLIGRIEAEARPREALFALPMEPELNFLTNRPAPVPYYSTAMGLRTDADVDDTMARLQKAAPIFVVLRRDDKYLTPLTRSLLTRIRQLDPVPEPFGPFDLYRLPAPAGSGARPIARE